MMYLATQIFAMLGLTAAAFFALGYVFHQRFMRAQITVSEQPPADPPPPKLHEEAETIIFDLRSRLLEKERDLAELLESVPATAVATEAVEDLKPQLASMLQEAEQLRTTLEEQVRSNAELIHQNQEWEKKFHSLEQLRVAMPDEIMQEKMESLSAEISLKNARIEEYQQEVDALHAKLADAEVEMAVVKSVQEQVPDEVETTASAQDDEEKQSLRQRIETLEAQLSEREYLLQMAHTPAPADEDLAKAADAIWDEEDIPFEVSQVEVEADDAPPDALSAPPRLTLVPQLENIQQQNDRLEREFREKIGHLEATIESLRNDNEIALSTALELARNSTVAWEEKREASQHRVAEPVVSPAAVPSTDLWGVSTAPARPVEDPASDPALLAQVAALWQEEKDAERDRLRRSVDNLKDVLEQKEKAILEMEEQLAALSGKVDPALTGPDDLELIKGIGPFIRKMLEKEFHVKSYEQVAKLSQADIDRISAKLFFADKIQREDWLGQAVALHLKKYNELIEVIDPPYPLKWVD